MKHDVISMIPRPEIEEFPQAKEATDVKIQDESNVDLLFGHQGYRAPFGKLKSFRYSINSAYFMEH
jgi:hypothetical protein